MGWLGPDVCEHIRTLHANDAEGIVTCELLSLTLTPEVYDSKESGVELGSKNMQPMIIDLD